MKTVRVGNGGMTPQPHATIILVRHATTAALGLRLCGRTRGVHLDAAGRTQARRLAAELGRLPLSAIYSGPLERVRETAAPIAAAAGLDVQVLDELDEVDFGEWTGLTFDALSARDDWRSYNSHRADAAIPQGEVPRATLARITAALREIDSRHRGETIVAVSHAEPIRYALLAASGAPLDEWHTMQIEPGQIASIRVTDAVAGRPLARNGASSILCRELLDEVARGIRR
jgi:broad specificity phosphatase PhoE